MKRTLVIVYITVFVDLLGFGIIIPSLPFYALHFHASGLWLGALMTSYSAAQLLGAPLWGRLSDRLGRKPVLLLCLLSSAASLFLTGLASSLPMLLAARTLAGLFGGSLGVASAVIADSTLENDRARYLGFLGASTGMGFVLGPALGAVLGGYGFSVTAFAAAGLALLNFAAGCFFLRETLAPGAARDKRSRPSLVRLRQALARPFMARLLIAVFFATSGFVVMETTFAPMAKDGLAFTAREFGYLFSWAGFIMVVVQGGLLGRLVARFGEARLVVAGGLMGGLALFLLPYAARGGHLNATIYLMALLAIGYSLISPCLSALLSRLSDPREQGGVLGLGQGTSALARALAPLLAGLAFDISPQLPYVVAAVLMALSGAVIARAK